MANSKRVLIMAGGTGGHVFPALAVAHELQQRGTAIDWLGTSAGIEAELVPANGFTLHTIDVQGVRGKGVAVRILAPFRVFRSVLQALSTVKAIQPDSVIGLGGYASGPGGIAAWLLRIPLLIHEQNAIAGTTNRILAKFATRVFQAFPGAFATAETTGNPVRVEISQLPSPEFRQVGQHQPIRLLVLGGSLGALAINQLVPQALALVSEAVSTTQNATPRFEVRHQCGRKHVDITLQAYRDAGADGVIEPFIRDMAAAYSWADFIICRSGALTVSELAAAGVGALLIPFPAAIDDHQTANGQWLVQGGAAKLIQQRDLDAEKLAAVLADLAVNPRQMCEMANNARKIAVIDATQRVADGCLEVMP